MATRTMRRRVKSGMLALTLAAMLSGSGCASSASSRCERAKYWDGDQKRDAYLISEAQAFAIDLDTMQPTRGVVAYERLAALEKYCWQMRAK